MTYTELLAELDDMRDKLRRDEISIADFFCDLQCIDDSAEMIHNAMHE